MKVWQGCGPSGLATSCVGEWELIQPSSPYHAVMDSSWRDLQPGSNVKFVTEREGEEEDQPRFGALI